MVKTSAPFKGMLLLFNLCVLPLYMSGSWPSCGYWLLRLPVILPPSKPDVDIDQPSIQALILIGGGNGRGLHNLSETATLSEAEQMWWEAEKYLRANNLAPLPPQYSTRATWRPAFPTCLQGHHHQAPPIGEAKGWEISKLAPVFRASVQLWQLGKPIVHLWAIWGPATPLHPSLASWAADENLSVVTLLGPASMGTWKVYTSGRTLGQKAYPRPTFLTCRKM